jgi:hypothetical protein
MNKINFEEIQVSSLDNISKNTHLHEGKNASKAQNSFSREQNSPCSS